MLAHNCLDENKKFRSNITLLNNTEDGKVKKLSGFSLEQLAIERGCTSYLRTSMGKGDRASIFATPFKDVAEYGGLDTIVTWHICASQMKEARDRGSDYDKFIKIQTNQIRSMISAFVRMEITGLPIDRAYLAREQSLTTGTFEKARTEIRKELYSLDSVKEANRRLIEEEFGTSEDLFGRTDNWIFDIDKIDHQQMLFFDVLNLEPISVGKSGLPNTDKKFKDEYAPKADNGDYMETAIEEVKLFKDYGEHKFLHNTFIKAIYQHMFTNPDMKIDSRIRSNYDGLFIVTGRTGSSKPALQNIPSRSKLAKVVKRQFITKPGSIYVKVDFDSHETRNFAIAAKESKLADAYKLGIVEKNKFRLKEITTEEDWNEFEEYMKGFDIHRLNCRHFFGIAPHEVTKTQRSKVKTVAFGVLYGMAAQRLAITLNISVEEAEELIAKFFEQFPDGAAYINIIQDESSRYLICVSGIGRVRHMWGYLHMDYGVRGGMDRRSVNSMIQGVSSDEGMEMNYQLQKCIWDFFHSQDIPYELDICNTVHDSTETISPMVTAPVAAYLLEHAGSTLVHKTYRERYGVEFNVGLELGFEFGPSLGAMHDWNYRPEQLEKIILDSDAWAQKELRYAPLTDSQLKAFRHNNKMMFDLRRRELQGYPKNFVNETMLFDKAIARQIAL